LKKLFPTLSRHRPPCSNVPVASRTYGWFEVDPNKPKNAAIARVRASKETAGYVTDTIKFFDDQERKQILDQVLSELDSKLVVQRVA